VVAMDQPGHGESVKPDHGYDFATVSGDVSGLANTLGLDAPIIVGHSYSGDVGLELAVAEPGLVGNERLQCICTESTTEMTNG